MSKEKRQTIIHETDMAVFGGVFLQKTLAQVVQDIQISSEGRGNRQPSLH